MKPNRRRAPLPSALALACTLATAASGDPMPSEDFSGPPAGWRMFTDQVMGGVSTGAARLETDGTARALRLTGTVSTANNGGFIQARWDLPAPVPASARGVEIEVRGNGQRYYLHLRTRAARLPWQYYQAPFETGPDWTTLQIPFTAFTPQGGRLEPDPSPETLRSLALVAYGRDHAADVSLRRVRFY